MKMFYQCRQCSLCVLSGHPIGCRRDHKSCKWIFSGIWFSLQTTPISLNVGLHCYSSLLPTSKKKTWGSLHIIIGTRFGAKGFFQWTCVNILGFLFKINLGFLKCSFKVESLRCTKPFFLCYFSSFINNSYSKYLHSVITCLYSSFWCRWQTLGFQLCNHTLVIHRKWCTYYVMR